jgi:endonuclease/exonuclease/phosphatase family metal-dependent hydrolase
MLRLDRVFIDGGVKPIALTAHRSEATKVASDHLPLVLDFDTVVEPTPTANFPARIVA